VCVCSCVYACVCVAKPKRLTNIVKMQSAEYWLCRRAREARDERKHDLTVEKYEHIEFHDRLLLYSEFAYKL